LRVVKEKAFGKWTEAFSARRLTAALAAAAPEPAFSCSSTTTT
jgi:hypothetical protein